MAIRLWWLAAISACLAWLILVGVRALNQRSHQPPPGSSLSVQKHNARNTRCVVFALICVLVAVYLWQELFVYYRVCVLFFPTSLLLYSHTHYIRGVVVLVLFIHTLRTRVCAPRSSSESKIYIYIESVISGSYGDCTKPTIVYNLFKKKEEEAINGPLGSRSAPR